MSGTPKRPDIGAVRRWAYSADRRTGACELGDVLAVCDWAEHLERKQGESARKSTEVHRLRGQDHAKTSGALWDAQKERDDLRNELADVKIEAGILRQDRDNCEVSHRTEVERLTAERDAVAAEHGDEALCDQCGHPWDCPAKNSTEVARLQAALTRVVLNPMSLGANEDGRALLGLEPFARETTPTETPE